MSVLRVFEDMIYVMTFKSNRKEIITYLCGSIGLKPFCKDGLNNHMTIVFIRPKDYFSFSFVLNIIITLKVVLNELTAQRLAWLKKS